MRVQVGKSGKVRVQPTANAAQPPDTVTVAVSAGPDSVLVESVAVTVQTTWNVCVVIVVLLKVATPLVAVIEIVPPRVHPVEAPRAIESVAPVLPVVSTLP